MKPNTIMLTLAGLLGVASRAPAAQELSTTALKTVRGGIQCISASHYCVCDVYHSGCCSGSSSCTSIGGGYYQKQFPDDYWTCSNGGTWNSSCNDTSFSADCCTKKTYLDSDCSFLWSTTYDSRGTCSLC